MCCKNETWNKKGLKRVLWAFLEVIISVIINIKLIISGAVRHAKALPCFWYNSTAAPGSVCRSRRTQRTVKEIQWNPDKWVNQFLKLRCETNRDGSWWKQDETVCNQLHWELIWPDVSKLPHVLALQSCEPSPDWDRGREEVAAVDVTSERDGTPWFSLIEQMCFS